MAESNNAVKEQKNVKEGKHEEEAQPNEIRVGQRRSEAYVKTAEQLFLQHEEITLCGLGNTMRTVVSCAEIIKNRKYATVIKIETSMIEGDPNTRSQAIAKILVSMKRNPGVKEQLEKLAEERKHETELEKHMREQEEKEREREQDM